MDGTRPMNAKGTNPINLSLYLTIHSSKRIHLIFQNVGGIFDAIVESKKLVSR